MSLAPASRYDHPTTPHHRIKAAVDRTGAAVLLVLALPWLGLIALAIWAEDAGPVLRRERRLGRWGREFSLLRFRTTTSGGRQDGQVTRVGAVLRRYAVEGLPQLINVLRGICPSSVRGHRHPGCARESGPAAARACDPVSPLPGITAGRPGRPRRRRASWSATSAAGPCGRT